MFTRGELLDIIFLFSFSSVVQFNQYSLNLISPHIDRPTQLRELTWSWASTDGILSYQQPKRVRQVYISLVDAAIKHVSHNSFEEVSEGVLKLECEVLLRSL